MPDAKRKKGVSHGQAQEEAEEGPEAAQAEGVLMARHGVDVLAVDGVDSYTISKLCLALRACAKLNGLRGVLTVRLDGRILR